jgi:hypothetical protein
VCMQYHRLLLEDGSNCLPKDTKEVVKWPKKLTVSVPGCSAKCFFTSKTHPPQARESVHK